MSPCIARVLKRKIIGLFLMSFETYLKGGIKATKDVMLSSVN